MSKKSKVDLILKSERKSMFSSFQAIRKAIRSIRVLSMLCVLINSFFTLTAGRIVLDGIEYDYFPGQRDYINAVSLKDQTLKTVVIPSIASNGMKVGGIVANAFSNQDCIEHLIIEDGVDFIESNAFENCVNLRSVELPDYIRIYYGVFKDCTSLTAIKVPAYDLSKNSQQGKYMLQNCTSLTDVSFAPNATLSVGMFFGCTSLKYVKLPSEIENIPSEAFRGCTSLKDILTNCKNLKVIGGYSFYGCTNMDNISLPESVESIEMEAFSKTSLKQLIIPSSVKSLGNTANNGIAEECPYLTDIIINGNFTVNLEPKMVTRSSESVKSLIVEGCRNLVGNFNQWPNLNTVTLGVVNDVGTAFRWNEKLETLIIDKCTKINKAPKSIKNVKINQCDVIGEDCFRECEALESLSLNNVREIGTSAFKDCNALKELLLPEGVEKIGGSAFSWCRSLEKVKISGAPEIGYFAFGSCPVLTSVELDDRISTIGREAFKDCVSLQEINIPETLVEINNQVFSGCASLQSIYFHKGLITLRSKCFRNCGLESVEVPESVTNISDAFIGCEKLKNITVLGVLDQYIKLPMAGNEENVSIGGCTGLSANSKSFVKSISIGSIVNGNSNSVNISFCPELISVVINKGCEEIKFFNRNPKLRMVVIPSVKKILRDAFSGCESLEEVVADNIVSIGGGAFRDCHALKSINLEKVEQIEDGAFGECRSLTEVRLLNENAVIGRDVFSGCQSLEEVEIKGYIACANNYFFAGCDRLKSVIFDNCEVLGQDLCNNKIELEYFSSPNTKYIEKAAFANCINLKEFDFGDGLISIGSHAFQNTGLECIVLPESVLDLKQNIDDRGGCVFADCKNLTSVTLSSQIQEIPTYAFSSCENLQEIVLPASLLVIKERAFKDNKSLSNIVIPSQVTDIGNEAFWGCDNLKYIVCLNEIPPGIAWNPGVDYNAVNLYVKEDYVEAYRNSGWSPFFREKPLHVVPFRSYSRDWKGFDSILEAKGCTADGQTQLLLWYESPIDSSTCRVKFYKQKLGLGGGMHDPDDLYDLINDESNVKLWRYKDQDNSIYFSELGNSKGYVYTAPEDYNEFLSSYQLKIDIVEDSSLGEDYDCKLVSAGYFSKKIDIWRPACVLVHGLWSDSTALVPLQKYLLDRYIYKNEDHVFCANYKSTNSESFYDNTHKYKVIDKNLRAVHDSLYFKYGIISSAYDLVGHSMGGILSRLYAGLGEKERSHVNRIITLNTPHSGSQWADFVEDVTKNLNLISLDFMNIEKSMLLNSLFIIAKNYWIENFPMAVDGLGVSNGPINNYLNWGSNLCKGVPVHSVVTYLNTPPSLPDEIALFLDFYDLIEKMNPIEKLKEAFKDLINSTVNNNVKIPSNPYQIGLLLSSEAGKYELNDLVVPFKSQTGGLKAPSTRTINSDWLKNGLTKASHMSSYGYDQVQSHIADCLMASKNSEYYSMDGFKPEKLRYTWPEAKLNTRSENDDSSSSDANMIYDVSDTSILKLSNVKVEDNIISFDIIKGDDMKSNSVIGAGKDGFAFWDSNNDAYSFELPRVFDDDVDLVLFGVNDANELVVDSIGMHIKTALNPEKILMSHSQEKISLSQGSSVFISATAKWADGYEENVKPVLTADNDCVIIRDFEVIGYKPGDVVIKAEYAGCVDSCYVTVIENIDGIVDIEPVVQPVDMVVDEDYVIMTVNSSHDVAVSFLPENAESIKVIWKSSDDNVATVDDDGRIKAVSVGECRINGYTLNGLECGCEVKVVSSIIKATGIDINPEEAGLDVGESLQLSCVITPEDASDKRIDWSSDDSDIAVVDNNGVVRKLAKGSCLIHAKSIDGSNLEATCIIRDNELSVADIPAEAVMDIYDVSGYRIKANASVHQLRDLDAGIYIVVIEGKSYKVTK